MTTKTSTKTQYQQENSQASSDIQNRRKKAASWYRDNLSIPRNIREESVQRHQKWQEGLNKDAFFDDVFEKTI